MAKVEQWRGCEVRARGRQENKAGPQMARSVALQQSVQLQQRHKLGATGRRRSCGTVDVLGRAGEQRALGG